MFANGVGSPLLGKTWNEVSQMSSTIAPGEFVALYADWKALYVIVDRLGLTVEPIQHTFATANNRPSGKRGLFGWARTGGGVAVANAGRLLRIAGT